MRFGPEIIKVRIKIAQTQFEQRATGLWDLILLCIDDIDHIKRQGPRAHYISF